MHLHLTRSDDQVWLRAYCEHPADRRPKMTRATLWYPWIRTMRNGSACSAIARSRGFHLIPWNHLTKATWIGDYGCDCLQADIAESALARLDVARARLSCLEGHQRCVISNNNVQILHLLFSDWSNENEFFMNSKWRKFYRKRSCTSPFQSRHNSSIISHMYHGTLSHVQNNGVYKRSVVHQSYLMEYVPNYGQRD